MLQVIMRKQKDCGADQQYFLLKCHLLWIHSPLSIITLDKKFKVIYFIIRQIFVHLRLNNFEYIASSFDK